ncbi:hypothetical protein [Streptomyces sp. NPDC058745]|uniref:hypothetical protein n=1 Tax=Streptomyces sp. NPDC058745 TaxID=3346621 RepID=UPI00369C746C
MTKAPMLASTAVTRFVDSLSAPSTRRQRRVLLEEYTGWITAARGPSPAPVTLLDLLDEENAEGWLRAAMRGETRRRNSLRGQQAQASLNSMAARVSTLNSFSAYYGSPLSLQRQAAEYADRLSPADARRVLQSLAQQHPAGMLEASWERSVAVISVAITTGQGFSALHAMRLDDVDLDHRPLPRVRVGGRWHSLVDATASRALERWLQTHEALTAGALKVLQGGDVQQLWVTTAPGRPRGGKSAPPAGLPAAVRTLESAHRKLTAITLGAPLLLEQFCSIPEDAAMAPGSA